MIDTNLATRPFYNERTVSIWLTVAALLALTASFWNVSRVVKFSGSSTELATKAADDQARAAEFRREAARLRAGVDARQIEAASIEARQANELIDRRTFSWTELFNRFELTLPDDARITSATPRLDRDRRIMLTIVVLGRRVDDVDEFMQRLDRTGNFRKLHSASERTTEEGLIESVLEAEYLPIAGAEAGQTP